MVLYDVACPVQGTCGKRQPILQNWFPSVSVLVTLIFEDKITLRDLGHHGCF
jgi:hypothetical protein